MIAHDNKTITAAENNIRSGAWVLLNEEITNGSRFYAVQQYRDNKGLVQTVGLSREGNVLAIAN